MVVRVIAIGGGLPGPGGKSYPLRVGVPDKLVELHAEADREAVFENPEHDFPKRIIYRKNSAGGLSAIVDGGEGTKSEKFDFKTMPK